MGVWLGAPGSALRRARVLLAGALLAWLAWLVGPLRPGLLAGAPTLVPAAGQSHIHTVLVASWWAAAVNAALCALLLATSGLWLRSVAPLRPAARAPRLGRSGWLLIAAAVLLAGALRAPLARGSLWWDEAWNIRNTIVGKLDVDAEDPSRLVFQPASWRKTLWYYHSPTNHVGFTVAARVSTDLWRALAGAEPQAFDEFAYRLPAFLAALGAVALAGVLVASLGFPVAAPAVALLLAIHPLHVRYGADGRGYSFVVLLTLAGAWLLLQALRDGRWRWWLAYGATQFALLSTFPLAIHVPLAFALAGSAAIAVDARRSRAERWLLFSRFVVANLLAAMAFLQLMAPNLAQAAAFEKEWNDAGRLDGLWLRRFWVMMTTGLQIKGPKLPDVAYPTLLTLSAGRPWILLAVYGLLPLLALWGVLRALRRGGAPERAIWLGLVGATLLFFLHRELQAFFILPRFVIFALPALVCLPVVGLEGALGFLARGRRAVVAGGLALGLAGFAALVAPALRVLLTHPATPSRELVALLAEAGDGRPGGVLRAGLGLGGDAPRVYDPAIVEIERAEQLDALCERARREQEPLYVFYAYGTVNQKRLPDLFIWVRDDRYFEPVARLDGIDQDMVIRVRRYTGRPFERP